MINIKSSTKFIGNGTMVIVNWMYDNGRYGLPLIFHSPYEVDPYVDIMNNFRLGHSSQRIIDGFCYTMTDDNFTVTYNGNNGYTNIDAKWCRVNNGMATKYLYFDQNLSYGSVRDKLYHSDYYIIPIIKKVSVILILYTFFKWKYR